MVSHMVYWIIAWNQMINKHLVENGYIRCPIEPCIYVKKKSEKILIMGIHVDDMLYCASSLEIIQEFEEILESEFQLKKTGDPNSYLGMGIHRDGKYGIFIEQTKYKVVEEYRLEDSKGYRTPMETGLLLENSSREKMEDITLFQQIVGSLLYANGFKKKDRL